MGKQGTKAPIGIGAIGFLHHKNQNHVSFGSQFDTKIYDSPHLVLLPSIPTIRHKGNNKITEHRAFFQRERQNS